MSIQPCGTQKNDETYKDRFRIYVPDDHATLPDAVAAASEYWREMSNEKADESNVPCIVVRSGEHGWHGTMQVCTCVCM